MRVVDVEGDSVEAHKEMYRNRESRFCKTQILE